MLSIPNDDWNRAEQHDQQRQIWAWPAQVLARWFPKKHEEQKADDLIHRAIFAQKTGADSDSDPNPI